MLQQYFTKTPSPLGDIVLTLQGEGLTGLYTAEHCYFAEAQNGLNEPKFFEEAIEQLNEYFNKKRKIFDLKLAPTGTDFQQKVWKILSTIPYGKTITYGAIAKLLNMPNASRAVGLANSKNPICIIVPCHRVIGSNGKLTGYAGGMKTKDWLLKHEDEYTSESMKYEQTIISGINH